MSSQNSYQLFHNQLKLYTIYEKLSRPIIVSDNIQSPANIGAILRLAGNIGADRSLFISDENHKFKNNKVERTSSGASKKVVWKTIQPKELNDNIPPNYTIVALETDDKAQNIYEFEFPEKTAFLIGNEIKGISDEIIQHAEHKIFIPIPGPISSLNVTHALSIALFEWLRQKIIF
jgi:tRNA G18 (ribose-2'-O)-methylase SpoU